MATLERLVGKQLIERPRGTEAANLTEAGEILHRHAPRADQPRQARLRRPRRARRGRQRHVPVRHLPEREHEHPAARAAPVRAALPARARASDRVGRRPLARARPRGGHARRVLRHAADARGAAGRGRAAARSVRAAGRARLALRRPHDGSQPGRDRPAAADRLEVVARRRGRGARARLRAQRDHALRRQRHGALARGRGRRRRDRAAADRRSRSAACRDSRSTMPSANACSRSPGIPSAGARRCWTAFTELVQAVCASDLLDVSPRPGLRRG